MSKKSRFDGLDVAAMTSYLQKTVLGYKLVNIYDGPSFSASSAGNTTHNKQGGTYFFKLSNTYESQSSQRSVMLLIESGVRFHLTGAESSASTTAIGGGRGTAASAAAASQPSPFAMKLRKHIRNSRLEHVTQLGSFDRVVDIRFGSGSTAHHVMLELYGQGNIVLTDANYVILALLRIHEFDTVMSTTVTLATAARAAPPLDENDGGKVKVRVGNVYPVTYTTTLSWKNSSSFHSNPMDTASTTTTDESTNTSSSTSAITDGKNNSILEIVSGEEAIEWALNQFKLIEDLKQNKQELALLSSSSSSNMKKINQSNKKTLAEGTVVEPSITLKALLLRPTSGVFHYGPSVIEHCILHTQILTVQTKLSPSSLVARQVIPPASWELLIQSLKVEGSRILHDFQIKESKGYILYRMRSVPVSSTSLSNNTATMIHENTNIHSLSTSSTSNNTNILLLPHSDKIFEDFQPHLLHQHEGRTYLEYPTFTQAVDEYFSLLDGQRKSSRLETIEIAARQKLEKIRLDQEKRLLSLQMEAEAMFQHAELIELYADDVDKVLSVINSALASGMDWQSLEQLVAVEKAHENPIALLVHHLNLKDDQVIISLPENYMISSSFDDNEDEDDEEDKEGDHTHDRGTSVVLVQIPLSLHENSHGNARLLYDKYRVSKEKADKTMDASSKVMKAAEATAQKQLAEAQKSKKNLSFMTAPRKIFWFEKYHWFITSENYLVIAGRDAQQNEVLVKRFLREGDVYVHADVHGAASCILRAKRQRISLQHQDTKVQGSSSTAVLPISEQALREAGNFAICRSSAWSSKIITSAWWVHAHQVSKTAPTGEFLTTGSFMIRGKKNYLPATHLEMGVALLFCLGDDVSVARHAHDRRDLYLRQQDEESLEKNKVLLTTVFQSSSVNISIDKQRSVDQDKGKVRVESSMEEKEDDHETNELNCDDDLKVHTEEPDELDTGLIEAYQDMIDSHETLSQRDTNQLDEENLHASNDLSTSLDASMDQSSAPMKKGLSVKDRKLIKKYGSLEAAEKAANRLKQLEHISTKVKVEKSHTAIDTKNTAISRGKKAKIKKMSKKYIDQDDEDRELAILLLQGAGKQEKQDIKVKEKGSRSNIIPPISSNQIKASAETATLLFKDSTIVAMQLPEQVQEIMAKCIDANDSKSNIKDWAKCFDADVLEEMLKLTNDEQVAAVSRLCELKNKDRIDNYSASLLGIIRTLKRFGLYSSTSSEGHFEQVLLSKGLTKDAVARNSTDNVENDEEGTIGLTDLDVIDDTTEINKLTGKPTPEDFITHIVAVCSPYLTLSQYKYKIKLVPGAMKRGKAAKQCLELFVKNSKTDNRDSDLIKLITENEVIQVLCGDVKIAVAGGKTTKK